MSTHRVQSVNRPVWWLWCLLYGLVTPFLALQSIRPVFGRLRAVQTPSWGYSRVPRHLLFGIWVKGVWFRSLDRSNGSYVFTAMFWILINGLGVTALVFDIVNSQGLSLR